MKKPDLAIFANFFIDNDERLTRMKDSFNSFKLVEPNQWVINIRGSLRRKAGDFLTNEIGDKLDLFFLKSLKGWSHDSKVISKKINSKYVFMWVEDHIFISTLDKLNNWKCNYCNEENPESFEICWSCNK